MLFDCMCKSYQQELKLRIVLIMLQKHLFEII